MEFLMTLLSLLLEFLPMIINKPAEVRKRSMLRRMARYEKIAASPLSSPEQQFAFGEMADLCGCLAEADDAGAQAILGKVQTSCAAMQGVIERAPKSPYIEPK